jgi:hypothetical protein
LPTASSSLPGTLTGRAAPRPLFGLAPGGVYHATPVTRRAVRSYRTISPLPVPGGACAPSAIGGVLSAALSVASRRPGVTRHPALWSSDFPRRHRDAAILTRLPPCPTEPNFALRSAPVPRRGLEPPRRFRHQILSLACLPISAPGQLPAYAPERTRTSTGLRPLDPESSASTNSATGAQTIRGTRR